MIIPMILQGLDWMQSANSLAQQTRVQRESLLSQQTNMREMITDISDSMDLATKTAGAQIDNLYDMVGEKITGFANKAGDALDDVYSSASSIVKKQKGLDTGLDEQITTKGVNTIENTIGENITALNRKTGEDIGTIYADLTSFKDQGKAKIRSTQDEIGFLGDQWKSLGDYDSVWENLI